MDVASARLGCLAASLFDDGEAFQDSLAFKGGPAVQHAVIVEYDDIAVVHSEDNRFHILNCVFEQSETIAIGGVEAALIVRLHVSGHVVPGRFATRSFQDQRAAVLAEFSLDRVGQAGQRALCSCRA